MRPITKILATTAVLLAATVADGGPLRRIVASATATGDGHAAAMAASGRIFHSGRFAPGASYEGVGFSTVSPQDAIRHCCYWGQRTPVSIDVRRGTGGWFAVVQYR